MTPRSRPKQRGFGPEWVVRTGATNRSPSVDATSLAHEGAVPRKSCGFRCVVQVEVAGGLLGRGLVGVAAVTALLLLGQEGDVGPRFG